MANNDIMALLPYHALTGTSLPFFVVVISVLYIFLMLLFFGFFLPAPLIPNPTSELERIVNDLHIKYKTYTVELDVLD
jgi:hypothetical protein